MNEEERKYLKDKLEFLAYTTLGNIEVDRIIDIALVYIDALICVKKNEAIINIIGEK